MMRSVAFSRDMSRATLRKLAIALGLLTAILGIGGPTNAEFIRSDGPRLLLGQQAYYFVTGA